jgi:DNA-binding protein HU-beta
MARVSKSQIVDEIAKSGIAKKEVNHIVDEFLKKIVERVKNGDEVVIVGFGTFKQKKFSEREGTNPQTKEKIKIPASITLGFKASDKLKEIVK